MAWLSDEIESQIVEQEAGFQDTISARRVLEMALLVQFCALASGLLADLLSRGIMISNLDWWYQYLSTIDEPMNYAPNLIDQDFLSFRKRFAQDVMLKRIRRVTTEDLGSTRIRIYGGHVYFWQEGHINRQLASLGSSIRLIVVGSHQARLHIIRKMFAKKTSFSSDGRFILGRIGPITAIGGAALFDFEREYAVSPYLPGRVRGFTDQARIAIRQATIRAEIEASVQSNEITPDNYEERFRTRRRSAIRHEVSHILYADAKISGCRDASASWRDAIREDICRFTQVPRSSAEIMETFQAAFYSFWESENSVLQPEERSFLENEIQVMRKENVLLVNGEDKLYCPLYERRQQWTLF